MTLTLKKELTLCEFQTVCGALSSERFYYAGSDGSGASPFVQITLSFPPPHVSPNVDTVCFGTGGMGMILRCVRKVTMSTEYGVKTCRIFCRRRSGGAEETYMFSII